MDTPGFARFWASWPRNVAGGYSRKGAKVECAKLWQRGHNETQTETICRHVEWLKSTPDWLKDGGMFIPAPAVYLRGQRWDGADIPEQATATSVLNDTAAYLAREAEHKRQAQADRIAAMCGAAVKRVA